MSRKHRKKPKKRNQPEDTPASAYPSSEAPQPQKAAKKPSGTGLITRTPRQKEDIVFTPTPETHLSPQVRGYVRQAHAKVTLNEHSATAKAPKFPNPYANAKRIDDRVQANHPVAAPKSLGERLARALGRLISKLFWETGYGDH
jgi:hypothetical protein